MNKSYISIWSDALGTWVAAPEFASARGKRSKARVVAGAVAALIVGSVGLVGNAQAGATYAAGGATAGGSSGIPAGGWNNPLQSPAQGIFATAVGSSANSELGGTAFGDTAVTSGYFGVALGAYTMAAAHATAVGSGAMATGSDSSAVGYNAFASAANAIALGSWASASGSSSVAIGNTALASAASSTALGQTATSSGQYSTALGKSATAVGASSAALGDTSVASGAAAVAIGQLSVASGTRASALGRSATASADYSTALGQFSTSTGANSTAVGGAVSAGQSSIALGNAATAGATSSVAIGDSAQVVNGNSIAIGRWAKADSGTVSGAWSTTSIGTSSAATGDGATALGDSAKATVDKATALGRGAQASALNSSAIGAGANATAANSVALGAGSTTKAVLTSAAYNPGATTPLGTTPAGEVSVGSSGNERRLTNVAAGSAATDAVNVSQLQSEAAKSNANGVSTAAALGGVATYNATTGAISAPSYTVGGTSFNNVGGAIQGLDIATQTNAGNIVQNTTNIQNLQGQMANAVTYDSPAQSSVTLGGVSASAPVALHNVANGVADTDAANVGQLNATATQLGNQIGSLGNTPITFAGNSGTVAKKLGDTVAIQGTATTAGTYSGSNLQTQVDGNGVLQVQMADNPEFNSVTTGGTVMNGNGLTIVGGPSITTSGIDAGGKTLGNLAQGTADSDAATVGQVNAAAANAANGATADAVKYDDASHSSVTLGGTGADTPVALHNVAAGTTGNDAVNVDQLNGVAQGLGGGAKVNADGTISAPSYSVGGKTVDNVGDAVSNLDQRTTGNTDNISNIQNQISNGSIGLVQQDATTRNITVAKDTDGTVVNMSGKDSTGNALNRTVTGVAAGAVNASSVDAINGSQLFGTASSAASALGGGSTVNADGTISAPTYNVAGKDVHNVGDAVSNLDGRVTQNTSDITTIQNQLGDVGTQLSGAVQYDRNADGSVNFGSVTLGGSQSAGPVVLTNVANGTSQYDAVNFGQLSALQNQVTDLNGQVSNLTGQVSNVQPGSPYFNATDVASADGSDRAVVHAAAPGEGVGSTAAGAGAVASGNYATVIGANANAAADNAVAVGANAVATGVNSTAIGAGSQAANTNSVALGQGSVTDRDNSVSVGSGTQQRQITNVAAGTADTDAVNVGQMNSSVAQGVQQANNYTDQRFGAMNNAINDVAKNAYAGIAAAMAMPNMTPSGPGKTIVAAGGATYKGGSAAAVGATYRSRNNKWLVNGAVSVTSTGDAGVRAQVGYEF